MVGACVLCLSGGKLVERGRSNEEHSNSRKTSRSDWLYTADCTHPLGAFNRAATCVCVCGVCLHFWDAALDSWVTVSQCYLPDCFSMFGIKAVFSLS